MRSLYWLTAITLVATAVTTVAVTDYGRRHPGTFFWQDRQPASHTIQFVSTASETATCQSKCPTCESTPVVASLPEPVSQSQWRPDGIPIVSSTVPAIPAYPEPPEHKQLREETMRQLTMMQDKKPPTFPLIPAPTPSVSDEFTFPGNAPTTLPAPQQLPAKSDFAAVPTLPTTPATPHQPDLSEFQATGPEVLSGLRAAKPVEDDLANPVRDCLEASAEVVTLMAIPVHLTALPPRPQTAVPVTAVAKDEHCCPAEMVAHAVAASCQEPKSCCKDCKACDDVVVRTYSVAEFASEKGSSHDELIRLITTMVAPDSWMTRDSNIEYFSMGKCLVVRHRGSVQEQIDDLLHQLHAAVQKQSGMKLAVFSAAPAPWIGHSKTDCIPVQFEVVPVAPQETPLRLTRVFTDEPAQCYDDDFFGLIPMRADGRLMPIPAYTPGLTDSSLLPATFTPMPEPRPSYFEEGPAGKANDKKPPGFFPMFLPFSPLPLGSELNEDGKKPMREKEKE